MKARSINAPIRQGANNKVLRDSAGHVPGTALPGRSTGNIVLAAHRDALFRNLQHARVGDEVRVDMVDPTGSLRPHLYRVTSLEVVDDTELSVLDQTEREMLTLLTCYPFDFVGSAPQRYVIRAVPVVLGSVPSNPVASNPS